ncbi:linoleate 13S-lipoxygenase 3-1, chloroplastic-like protein [Tanacetum coccineum]
MPVQSATPYWQPAFPSHPAVSARSDSFGIKLLREKELRYLRGDGTGVRKLSDRIYDYDVYNDLGNPDRGNDFIRPLLGGQKIPYPRRCRTGRAPSDTGLQDDLIKKLRLPNLVTRLHESSQGGGLLKYDTPKILSKDRFSLLHDDEFARQALAGVNPVSIEKLKVFPHVSQLEAEIYDRQESALKEEHILGYLNGMSVQ